jgi:CheY-like chemotaxis protein
MQVALQTPYRFISTFTKVYHEMTSRLLKENKFQVFSPNVKTINVLLADDDADDREFFMEVITEVVPRAKTTGLTDGISLMNFINDVSQPVPDLIFLDLNMPCKNGSDCLLEIRRNPRLCNIPVIIYSTSSHVKDIESAFRGGANLYITKPNKVSELVDITKKIFAMDLSAGKPQIEKFVLK